MTEQLCHQAVIGWNIGKRCFFFQKVLTHLSFPQTYEPFIFLSLKICILETEIEDVLKFDRLEACKGKKAMFGRLLQPQKLQKFKFSGSGKYV